MNQPVTQEMTSRRILIVDDEEFVVLTLQDGLKKLPHCELTVATNGEQALALCKQQPFDLLITDYRMPNMDGMTLAMRIRQLHPKIVIVMITACDSERLWEQVQPGIVQRILSKPVGIAEIRSAALETLDGLEATAGGSQLTAQKSLPDTHPPSRRSGKQASGTSSKRSKGNRQ